MRKQIILSIIIASSCYLALARAVVSQEQKIAGTFFGSTVHRSNYMFVLRTVLSFRSPWGGIPNNRQQAEKRVWDELILSYEAHRRQITVEQNEIDEKITETLKGSKVPFHWKKSPGEYEQWVRETLDAPVDLFENQMRHLVQIKKLHQQVRDSINPSITEEEAFQEFLNEHNSLSVELAEFDALEEAQQFYQRVKKDSDAWEEAVKKDRDIIPEDRAFRRPGFVALEFLDF